MSWIGVLLSRAVFSTARWDPASATNRCPAPDGDQLSENTILNFSLREYVTPTSFFREAKLAAGPCRRGGEPIYPAQYSARTGDRSGGGGRAESLGYMFSHYDLDTKKISPSSLNQRFAFLQLIGSGRF